MPQIGSAAATAAAAPIALKYLIFIAFYSLDAACDRRSLTFKPLITQPNERAILPAKVMMPEHLGQETEIIYTIKKFKDLISSLGAVQRWPAMIVCVGAINIDFIFISDRWPAEHEKYRADDYVCVGGGSAANTAVELSMLGRQVRIIGGLGTDDLGDFALRRLMKAGVNTDDVVRRPGWKTGCAAIRSAGSSKSILTAGTVDADFIFNSLSALEIQHGDHVHFSWAPLEDFHDQLHQWRRQGVSLSWETNGRMSTPTAEFFDVILMNADEKAMYARSGVLPNNWLTSSEHNVTVVVTLASIGAEAYFRGHRFFCGANKVKVVDRTGGGDAFDAGFLSAWLDRRPIDVCLKCGLESAAIIIGQLGPQRRSDA